MFFAEPRQAYPHLGSASNRLSAGMLHGEGAQQAGLLRGGDGLERLLWRDLAQGEAEGRLGAHHLAFRGNPGQGRHAADLRLEHLRLHQFFGQFERLLAKAGDFCAPYRKRGRVEGVNVGRLPHRQFRQFERRHAQPTPEQQITPYRHIHGQHLARRVQPRVQDVRYHFAVNAHGVPAGLKRKIELTQSPGDAHPRISREHQVAGLPQQVQPQP